MSAIQQILLSLSNSAQGSVFLKPFSQITSEASSFGGSARASGRVELTSGGLLIIQTQAVGDFTDQSGSDTYPWLVSGTSSLFSYRYTTSPISSPGLTGPTKGVWTPVGNGIVFNVSRSVGASQNSSSFTNFALILELARTSNTTEVLAQAQFNFNISASTSGNIIQ